MQENFDFFQSWTNFVHFFQKKTKQKTTLPWVEQLTNNKSTQAQKIVQLYHPPWKITWIMFPWLSSLPDGPRNRTKCSVCVTSSKHAWRTAERALWLYHNDHDYFGWVFIVGQTPPHYLTVTIPVHRSKSTFWLSCRQPNNHAWSHQSLFPLKLKFSGKKNHFTNCILFWFRGYVSAGIFNLVEHRRYYYTITFCVSVEQCPNDKMDLR